MAIRRILVLGLALVTVWSGCDSDETVAPSTAASSGSTTSTGTGSTSASATSSSSSSSTSTGGLPVPLGSPCADDADCAEGGFCIEDSDDDPRIGGGAPGGYCTQACETDADCTEGTCYLEVGDGICFLDCEIGPPLEALDDPLLPEKCHGREDLLCTSGNAGTFCYPICGSDAQCPAGRICDPILGVCADQPLNDGLPLGASCDPSQPFPGDCSGNCLDFSDADISVCSARCALGGELDGDDCGGLEVGLCVFRAPDRGPGDLAYCTAACTEHGQCAHPAFACTAHDGITGDLVPNGFCGGGAEACPLGTECAAPLVCTDTIDGPHCLDPQFPLGASAPP